MERSTVHFRALHKAVLTSLETGQVEPLRQQKRFLERIEREGMRLAEQEVYFRLLSGRGGYVRKMARRLVPITFVGHDAPAQAVVDAMQEVYRFSPFRTPVRKRVVDSLWFLDVPPAQFKRRKVFEPIVLMTLADLLWSGRVTVPGSRTYRDKWCDVESIGDVSSRPEPGRWVSELKRRLETAGALFQARTGELKLVKDGRLSVPRARRAKKDDQEDDADSAWVPQVDLPPIDIVDLLREVQEATGFLDSFRFHGTATRKLREEERRELAIAAFLALGLNIGLREVSRSLGRGFQLWKIRNFMANYFTAPNLRDAHRRIIDTWDRLGLGRPWGLGTTCSVDGRVVYSYAL